MEGREHVGKRFFIQGRSVYLFDVFGIIPKRLSQEGLLPKGAPCPFQGCSPNSASQFALRNIRFWLVVTWPDSLCWSFVELRPSSKLTFQQTSFFILTFPSQPFALWLKASLCFSKYEVDFRYFKTNGSMKSEWWSEEDKKEFQKGHSQISREFKSMCVRSAVSKKRDTPLGRQSGVRWTSSFKSEIFKEITNRNLLYSTGNSS